MKFLLVLVCLCILIVVIANFKALMIFGAYMVVGGFIISIVATIVFAIVNKINQK